MKSNGYIVKNISSKIIKTYFSMQFLVFLVVGGISALINFTSGFLFRNSFYQFNNCYEISILVGFTIGTLISFILNKSITFKAYDEKTSFQFIKFIIAAIISILIATAVGFLIKKLLIMFDSIPIIIWNMENVAHFLTIGIMTMYNFIVIKFFAFNKIGSSPL
jgi:putative flippase GtrA